jgi:hypothetical protein
MPEVDGPELTEGLNINLNTVKELARYTSTVYSYEPIFTTYLLFRPLKTVIADVSLRYNQFLETTKQDNKLSFYFQSTDFAHKVPLKFKDVAFLGEDNLYKPYDSSELSAIDSKMTSSLTDIKTFSENHFSLKTLRGTIAFWQQDLLPKGYTFYLTDKQLYILVISYKPSKNGYNYIGIVHTKG